MSPTDHNQPLEITNPKKDEPFQRKLTRREKRAFDRSMKKPKYRKIAKRIIDQKEAENPTKQVLID